MLVQIATVALLILLGLLTLARAVGLDAGPLTWAIALTPWIGAAAVVALLIAVLTRSWPLIAVAIVVVAVHVAWQLPLFIADQPVPADRLAQARSTGRTATVMTLNLKYGNADPATVVRLVEDNHVDLLALQELTPEADQALRAAGLLRLLPHSFARPASAFQGTGIWSRNPLTAARELSGYASRQLLASTSLAGGPVTVGAIHPVAPGRNDTTQWSQEYARLLSDLSGLPGAVVVAGDFNATRDHAQLRVLLGTGYRDAAEQAGAGLKFTFPQERRLPPLVAIDHVIARDTALRAVAMHVTTVRGSDHAAVIVEYLSGS